MSLVVNIVIFGRINTNNAFGKVVVGIGFSDGAGFTSLEEVMDMSSNVVSGVSLGVIYVVCGVVGCPTIMSVASNYYRSSC